MGQPACALTGKVLSAMKSILRYFSRVVILIALRVLTVISYGTTAKAASDCFDGLKPADCQLLNEASANLGTIKTFLLDYTLSFKATGLPDGAISLSAQGSGPVDLSDVGGSDVSAALSKMVFSNKLFSSLIAGSRSSAGSLGIRQVDGTLYVKGDQATKNQWYSLSMDKVLPAILTQPTMSRFSLADFSPDIVANVRRSGIAAIPGVLRGSIQGGRFVDGQATTQFTLDYNIAALLQYYSKPSNREQLRQYLSRGGIHYSDTDLDTV